MGCSLSSHRKVKEGKVPSGQQRGQVVLPTGAAVLEDGNKEGLASKALYDTRLFASEAARLLSLQGCNVLDTEDEPSLAAALFNVPCALVSLIDDSRLWFKSRKGDFSSCVDREGSFCSYITVPDHVEVLIVENALHDARFSGNPFVVGPPELRFYVGCPLVSSDGHRYGTLCVVDFHPRVFPCTVYNVLCNLAELTVRELERDVAVARSLSDGFHDSSCAGVPQLKATASEPVVLVDTRDDGEWQVMYANTAWSEMVGLSEDSIVNSNLWDVFDVLSVDELTRLKMTVNSGNPASVLTRLRGVADGAYRVEFRLASRDQLENAVPVGIPSFVPVSLSSPEKNETPSPEAVHTSTLFIGVARKISERKSLDCSIDSDSTWNTFSSRTSQRSPTHGVRVIRDGPGKPARLSSLQMGPLIGQGSYGKVYRGRLGEKMVAIKVLDLVDTEDSMDTIDTADWGQSERRSSSGGLGTAYARKVIMEAALSRHLAHPHIVPTFDFVIHESSSDQAYPGMQVWIVQHLCDKGTLYNAIDKGWLRQALSLTAGPSLSAVLNTAFEIATAMEYLHEQGILHGDLNGNNVLLSHHDSNQRSFVALVGDFGLSRAISVTQNTTRTVGTVTHMPPELLQEGLLTKAADVYAFGVLLWEMYCGRRAWAGASMGQVIFAVTCKQQSLTIPSTAPEELGRLMAACMHPAHAQRPSFSEVVEWLRRLRKEELES